MAEKRNILVIDDDPDLNRLVGAYVQIAGFKYESAANGLDGLELARAHSPAMILCDVMLPDTDGFEVVRRLKEDSRTSTVPVVMLTALNRPEDEKRGKDSGAVEYLTKPFNPDRLIEAIKRNAKTNGEMPKM